MNLVIISASQRKQSQSAKVAQYFTESSIEYENTVHLELCQYTLPLWDGEQASKLATKNDWNTINEHLRLADALIVITPEWGGMASPLLKNFLLMCSSQDTANKPVLITAISSGISGAYPIAELRMNAFKNNKLVAIPEHLIIRNVEEVLNTPSEHSTALTHHDQQIRERVSYSLYSLYKYSKALNLLRSEMLKHPHEKANDFAYGM